MEKWRKIIIIILLIPFLLGISLIVGLPFWIYLLVSFGIPIAIMTWLLFPKPVAISTTTDTTATSTTPEIALPATQPAQSGWKKYKGLMVPATAVIVFAGVVWILFSAGYLDTGYKTATGWIPAKPLAEEPLESSCSMPIFTETGFYYNIRFDEGGYSNPGGCAPFNESQVFSLEVIEGTTKYWNGETSSEADANGTVGQSEYKLPGARNLPLGIVVFGIDSQPVVPLGKQKLYFKVAKTHLEVYDKKDNGTLIKKIPITLPTTPGGYSSRMGLMGNSLCDIKSKDGKKTCTAAFTVRQEYYIK